MPNEKSIFDCAVHRAKNLCYIYGLVHKTRAVSNSAAIVKDCKKYLNFNKKDVLFTLRGKGADREESLLFIKNPPANTSADDFDHDNASELLRSAIVSAVSALDRYMHEITNTKCSYLLRKRPKTIPAALLKLEKSATATLKGANPISKTAQRKLIREKLHEKTMQGSGQIDICLQLIGMSGFWNAIASNMGSNLTAKDVKERLNNIVKRRNQIVHEADLIIKPKLANIKLREISREDVEHQIKFIVTFVEKADALFEASGVVTAQSINLASTGHIIKMA